MRAKGVNVKQQLILLFTIKAVCVTRMNPFITQFKCHAKRLVWAGVPVNRSEI